MRGSRKRKSPRKSERVQESRERESAEVLENSVRILAPAVRVLGCLSVRASRNSIFVQQCRLVLPSSLALPFPIVLASLRAVASLLTLVSLLVSADLLQGSHSQAEKHTRGERACRKIANREGRASSVVAHSPLSGSLCLRPLCLRQMGRMARCAQVSECKAQQQEAHRKGFEKDFSATDAIDINCRKIKCSVAGSHADAAAGSAP